MKKFAFSLPEALLAMTIIGVIGALTVPSLKNHADEQMYVSSLKKAYNSITSATAQLETKYGNTEMWNWGTGQDTIRGWYNGIMNGQPISESYTVRQLAKSDIWATVSSPEWFRSSDGMNWYLQWWEESGMHYIMYVDTNGNAKPNMVGIDVHAFSIENDGVFPLGANMHYGNTWWACTNYALRRGEMPWIKDSSYKSCSDSRIKKEM